VSQKSAISGFAFKFLAQAWLCPLLAKPLCGQNGRSSRLSSQRATATRFRKSGANEAKPVQVNRHASNKIVTCSAARLFFQIATSGAASFQRIWGDLGFEPV